MNTQEIRLYVEALGYKVTPALEARVAQLLAKQMTPALVARAHGDLVREGCYQSAVSDKGR